MTELTPDGQLREALRTARVIAVLGAHGDPARPAFYVPDYLHAQGYRILPVNPQLAGHTLWGEPARASLAALAEPVDIVDVFRRPDQLPGHLADVLAMAPRPRLVWLQQGIRHADFVRAVQDAGIDAVQDRCALVEHRRLGVGRVAG
jgi:predicted CoA-binding protein